MIRRIFGLLWYGIVSYLPPSYAPGGVLWRKLRSLVCRQLFEYCGKEINVERKAQFGLGNLISIGNHSGIGINARLVGHIIIGNDVMMGPDVIIYSASHAFSRTDIPMRKQGVQELKTIRIGDDVWIGARAIILPGVTIGSGSIVAAGTVVTKDVPDFAIAAGNPARVVKFRNENHER